jgi:hypothetical protein
MLSTVITTDGLHKNVEPSNGTDFSLEELNKFVGGYIEIVRLSKSQVMVVNEEGKIMGLDPNLYATLLAQIAGHRDTIVGNVLVCDINKIK